MSQEESHVSVLSAQKKWLTQRDWNVYRVMHGMICNYVAHKGKNKGMICGAPLADGSPNHCELHNEVEEQKTEQLEFLKNRQVWLTFPEWQDNVLKHGMSCDFRPPYGKRKGLVCGAPLFNDSSNRCELDYPKPSNEELHVQLNEYGIRFDFD